MECLLCGSKINYFGICLECADKCDYEMTEEEQIATNETVIHKAMVRIVDETLTAEEEEDKEIPTFDEYIANCNTDYCKAKYYDLPKCQACYEDFKNFPYRDDEEIYIA